VGRTRFDLQQRLERTPRAIRRALTEHLTEATDVFSSLLVSSSSGHSGGWRTVGMTVLRAERAHLQHLLAGLSQLGSG
jgi:hypothetical protein